MAALFLQLITFVLISAFCIWLFHQLFPDNFVLIVMGSMAVTTSVVLTMLFQTVGSDYLFLALVLVFVYVCDLYIKEGGVVALWMMIIIAALAMLQRYIGVSFLFTGEFGRENHKVGAIWSLGAAFVHLGIKPAA